MDFAYYLLLIALGLVAGGSGGLLGIGGSLVMIPGMILLFGAEGRQAGQDPQHLYQAAAMIVNFFVVLPAVVRHSQARATIPFVIRLDREFVIRRAWEEATGNVRRVELH